MDELERRYVLPYYLHMMRLNALTADQEQLASIHELGPTLTAETVVHLLRSAWRPRVMGGWLALFQDTSDIGAELLRSLETSDGSLTSPVLATVAAYLLGREALASVETCASIDLEREYGAAGFIAGVIEHLGEKPHHGPASDEARDHVAEMLSVAATLRRA